MRTESSQKFEHNTERNKPKRNSKLQRRYANIGTDVKSTKSIYILLIGWLHVPLISCFGWLVD
jgi:hypothetical protein